jgi:hypothetical protein
MLSAPVTCVHQSASQPMHLPQQPMRRSMCTHKEPAKSLIAQRGHGEHGVTSSTSSTDYGEHYGEHYDYRESVAVRLRSDLRGPSMLC